MRNFDLSPLFHNTVGFDRLDNMFNQAFKHADAPTFPPYDIVRQGEDQYRISLAVAGFGEDDLEIVAEGNSLTIIGKGRQETPEDGVDYMHRGIAKRAFERRFQLADTVQVQGADLVNGLLHVDLVNVIPEASKPRTIAIGDATGVAAEAA